MAGEEARQDVRQYHPRSPCGEDEEQPDEMAVFSNTSMLQLGRLGDCAWQHPVRQHGERV